jgi:CelD/BcsL family acetyltransferase involved in cellulose biosynthesis
VSVTAGARVSDDELDRWARLQERDDGLASPFFRPEFAQIVAAVRRDVEIGVVRGEDAEAFFPFQRRRFSRGVPLGSRLSDYHGIVGAPPADLGAHELLARCGLRSWSFDAVVASQSIFQPYHRRARSSPTLELGHGFRAYVERRASAGSDQIGDIERQAERLAAEAGRVRFEEHVDDAGTLELLLRWKSQQYVRTGAVDIFAFPWVRGAVSRAHATNGPNFAAPLSVLYAGDRAIAAHLGLRSASVWHYWLPAYDREFARYSPGLILLLRLAEAASLRGVGRVDLGKGDALYKRRLATAHVPLAAGSVEAGLPAAASAAALRGVDMLVRKTPLATRLDRIATRRAFA